MSVLNDSQGRILAERDREGRQKCVAIYIWKFQLTFVWLGGQWW
jgi:hypothetical protein